LAITLGLAVGLAFAPTVGFAFATAFAAAPGFALGGPCCGHGLCSLGLCSRLGLYLIAGLSGCAAAGSDHERGDDDGR